MECRIKRWLSVLVALAVVMGSVQLSVFASGGEDVDGADRTDSREESVEDSNDGPIDDGQGDGSQEEPEDQGPQDELPPEEEDDEDDEPEDPENQEPEGREPGSGAGPDEDIEEKEDPETTPVAAGGIVAEDVTVRLGDPEFHLLEGVSARSADGEELEVTVADEDGFDLESLGVYRVRYEAVDEAAEETYTATRRVQVVAGVQPMAAPLGATEVEDETGLATALAGGASVIYLKNSFSIGSAISISGDVTLCADAEVTLTAAGSRHFVIASGADVELEFENVVLDGDGSGGGIDANNIGSLTLRGAVIENCSTGSGGALYMTNSGDLTLEDCEFVDNHVAYSGGAVYYKDGTQVQVVDSRFEGNGVQNSDGGAMMVQNADALLITGSNYKDNTAGYSGGALYLNNVKTVEIAADFTGNRANIYHGGAIIVFGGDNFAVTNSSFNGNRAEANGGGGIFLRDAKQIVVDGSRFEKNFAQYSGSAIFAHENSGAEFAISGSYFEDNKTNTNGTLSIEDKAETVRITDSEFVNNRAAYNSGAINLAFAVRDITIDNVLMKDNVAGEKGGALCFETSDFSAFTLKNSTVIGNQAVTGTAGGLFLNIHGTGQEYGGISVIRNTIIEGNSAGTQGGGIMLCNSELEVYDCKILRNTAGAYGGGISLEWPFPDKATIAGETLVEGNVAAFDGGGLFIPYERVSQAFVGADVKFENNQARSFALGFKDANDERTHNDQVATSHFSLMPGSATQRFATAYNNYDINYTNDIPVDPGKEYVRVSYVGNGGVIAESGDQYHVVYVDLNGNRLLNEPAISKSGSEFLGWYTDNGTFQDRWVFESREVEGNMTLYACWDTDDGGTTNPGGGGGNSGGNGGESVGPGGSSGGGSGYTVTIPDQAVPLGNAPDIIEILDDDVPLGSLPKTGGRTRKGMPLLGALALLGIGLKARRNQDGEA